MVKRAGWWQALKRRSTQGRSVPNNGMIGVGTVADHPSDKTLAVALYLNRRLWPFMMLTQLMASWLLVEHGGAERTSKPTLNASPPHTASQGGSCEPLSAKLA